MEIDEINLNILKILDEDSRTPTKDISTMIEKSEKEVKERIRELRNKGIIRKFCSIIDWEKTNIKKVSALIEVKVVPERKEGFDKIASEIAKQEHVVDVFVTSGKSDLLVVYNADDMREVAEFVTEFLAPKKSIQGTSTHFILKKYKQAGVLTSESPEVDRLIVSP